MDDQSRALLAEKESLYKSMKQVQKISLWLVKQAAWARGCEGNWPLLSSFIEYIITSLLCYIGSMARYQLMILRLTEVKWFAHLE